MSALCQSRPPAHPLIRLKKAPNGDNRRGQRRAARRSRDPRILGGSLASNNRYVSVSTLAELHVSPPSAPPGETKRETARASAEKPTKPTNAPACVVTVLDFSPAAHLVNIPAAPKMPSHRMSRTGSHPDKF